MEGLLIQEIGEYTVVEFYEAALMDPTKLDPLGKRLYQLIDQEDRRKIVLDFGRVQYISSQFIGILLAMNKKLSQLPKSKMVLCSVGPRLTELLKITRLDRVLTVRSSQKEAIQDTAR